ncbi:arylesterase [Desulfovibrio ferrophilus]|uniref:SGNH-hydrolase lipoprotein, lysophospholipase L1-like subgroup n=1 Tax=Desulfovibrio ferrophilus TaxID=241368 RepID=A0A2Z6AW89_9BACT|nr:arylesterase [Desulfovibrio ferrophilus]BBD07491.1 SGNH-hydrolase lipoprotein, lysophospholipase L1-like subgroup [Desulfovibrio ferrophilus]
MAKLTPLINTLILIFFFAIGGCTPEPVMLRPLSPESIILAFGDSLTYGTGSGGLGFASPERTYPAELELLTGHPVINAGKPGELSAQGLNRLQQTLDRWQPELVILCHGGNDLLRRLPHQALKQHLSDMVRIIQNSDAQVILIGVPAPGLFLKTADAYTEIAYEFGIPLESTVLQDILADGALKSDTIHPNAKGYAKLAQHIDALLRASGALPALDSSPQ